MSKKRGLSLGIIAGLLVVQGFFQHSLILPTWKRDYATDMEMDEISRIDPAQMLAALTGFREMIAGILWVKADAFFDEGNYDAILPIIRLVTILDHKQIDVYSTGMWHIGYNFTDEESRSDRRYLPSSLALGAEGSSYNSETYELFFETGWIWYHKIQDRHDRAVEWFEEAVSKKDIQPARRNLLAQAYLKNNEPEKARLYLFDLLTKAEELYAEDQEYHNLQNRDTLELNHDNILVRMAQRGDFMRASGQPWDYQYDTEPAFDVGFSAKVTVPEPKVLQIEGTWRVRPVGTRVRLILKDADFKDDAPGGMDWEASGAIELDPPKDVTFMQEQLFVKNRRFTKRVDMSRDPTMYPFTKDNYVIEFYYNPRNAPPHIKDKFGYNGQGMTDQNYLNEEVVPGQRVIYAKFELPREAILRRGEYEVGLKTPVIKTVNYVERTAIELKNNVIQVPSLREGQ